MASPSSTLNQQKKQPKKRAALKRAPKDSNLLLRAKAITAKVSLLADSLNESIYEDSMVNLSPSLDVTGSESVNVITESPSKLGRSQMDLGRCP